MHPCWFEAGLDDSVTVFHEQEIFNSKTSSGCRLAGNDQLCGIISSLEIAFREERARGFRLNNCQDPTSFKRLNCRVNSILKTYSATNPGDWRQYAAWCEHSYVRHLLWENEDFELMLLCWSPGQTSRVHNHGDSHCWLTVLDGEVCEKQYLQTTSTGAGGAATGGVVQLEPSYTTALQAGDVAYINDHIALHAVGCPAAGKTDAGPGGSDGACAATPACTLHLYCPPIRRVKAFENGRVVECTPGFFARHSVGDAGSDSCSEVSCYEEFAFDYEI